MFPSSKCMELQRYNFFLNSIKNKYSQYYQIEKLRAWDDVDISYDIGVYFFLVLD